MNAVYPLQGRKMWAICWVQCITFWREWLSNDTECFSLKTQVNTHSSSQVCQCPSEMRLGIIWVRLLWHRRKIQNSVIELEQSYTDTVNMTNGSHYKIYGSQRRVKLHAIIYANHRTALSNIRRVPKAIRRKCFMNTLFDTRITQL